MLLDAAWNHDAGRRLQRRGAGDCRILRSSPSIFCRPRSPGARSTCSMRAGQRCGFSAARTGWCATPTGPMSRWRNARWGSGRRSSKISDLRSITPRRSSASARISRFSRSASAMLRAALVGQAIRRAFAALLPRHHPSARQQGRRAIGDRKAVGGSAGGDRRHR